MNRNKIKIIFLSFLLCELFLVHVAFAQTSVGDYQGPEASIRAFLCTPTVTNGGSYTKPLQANLSLGQGVDSNQGQNNPSSNDLYNCINRIYRFAIVLASAAAVLMIVIAGYIYMSAEGNSESVDKAKSIITSAITALVILFVGYILLKALNPDLVQFKNIQPPSVTPTTTSYSTGINTLNGNLNAGLGINPATGPTATESAIRQQLASDGININASAPTTQVAGMQPATVNEIMSLKNSCGSNCNVTVTGGTEPGHSDSGVCTHASGVKVDLAADSVLTNFIEQYTKIATRSDGAQQWQNGNTIFALETTQGTGPHWDLTVNCGN